MRSRFVTSIILLALAIALLGACSNSDEPEADGASSPTSRSAPPTDPTTPTTAPTTPPVTTAPAAPQSFTSPKEAVEALVDAWEAQDRPRASMAAPADAVAALFAVSPDGYALYGCDTGEFPTSRCNYRNRSSGGYVAITAKRVDPGSAAFWRVAGVVVS